jgi:hypothetical protein
VAGVAEVHDVDCGRARGDAAVPAAACAIAPDRKKHAPAMGASAIVISVFLLFAFIETRADFPIEGVVAFVIGMLGFAAVLFADHLRRL